MSSINDTNHINYSGNLYTIYPGSIPPQGNVNYGFYPSHPLAPPPKYEDVMSGHYPYTNDTSICPQSTLADINSNQHINCSETNYFQNLQSEAQSQQIDKNKRSDIIGLVFLILILTGIFFCRPVEQHSIPPPVFPLTQQQETGQTDVILLAPISKIMGIQRKLLFFFLVSIVAGFVFILLWKWA